MEVKLNANLPNLQSKRRSTPLAQGVAEAASFAENLRSAAKKSPATPEEVFERAFSDREHPDLRQLDEYLEGLIEKEMKSGGA